MKFLLSYGLPGRDVHDNILILTEVLTCPRPYIVLGPPQLANTRPWTSTIGWVRTRTAKCCNEALKYTVSAREPGYQGVIKHYLLCMPLL